MKLKKFSLIIAALFAITLFSNVVVFSATEEIIGAAGLKYAISSETTATVTGYVASPSSAHTLTIPKTVTLDETGAYVAEGGTSYIVTSIGASAIAETPFFSSSISRAF